MNHDEYLSHDALGLAALVRDGQVTASELLDTAQERVRLLNPTLNAVVRSMEDEARRTLSSLPPDGPFSGVPFLLKDLLSLYEGVPTSQGSRFTASFVPDHDTEMVRRYKRAGVVTFGKTNTPEFGLLPYTEPVLFGPARNPWDPSRITGGSSGGSAAAVAAGIVPMAGGGDGGGSIRIPASCCGTFGFKPTRGRTPTGPDFGELWQGSVVEHVLTRSVRDSAAMLDALSGPEPGAPYITPPPERPFLSEVGRESGRLRIAMSIEPILGKTVHTECRRAAQDAAALLESLGHQVVEAVPPIDAAAFGHAFLVMVCGELGADLEDASSVMRRRPARGELEPATRALALLSRSISAREYAAALRTLDRVTRAVGSFFEDYDALLTPTVAEPPPPVGSLQPSHLENLLLRFLGAVGSGRLIKALGTLDQVADAAFDFTPWTPLFNVTGQPAMSVPLYWTADGLPVGTHLVGRFADDAVLLRLAGQLERARPWFDRLPPAARGAGAPTA